MNGIHGMCDIGGRRDKWTLDDGVTQILFTATINRFGLRRGAAGRHNRIIADERRNTEMKQRQRRRRHHNKQS